VYKSIKTGAKTLNKNYQESSTKNKTKDKSTLLPHSLYIIYYYYYYYYIRKSIHIYTLTFNLCHSLIKKSTHFAIHLYAFFIHLANLTAI